MIDTIQILSDVFDFFASDPIGLYRSLYITASDSTHPLKIKIDQQLELVDSEVVEEVKKDDTFLFFYGNKGTKELDRSARIWILEQNLGKRIPEERLRKLCNASNMTTIEPYQYQAVADIKLLDDFLVPLKCFKVDGSVLIRNRTGFTVVPPIESVNSQYWLIQEIMQNELQDITSVRLDPLMVHPANDYPRIGYKMLVYGIRELDWERLGNLKQDEHGRWTPGKLSTRSAYTDYAWIPRDKEIHFLCEELPVRNDISTRGSRYMHAIYKPDKKSIVHLDGAIRVYNSKEWDIRQKSHLRKEGKIGKRIKIFLIDSEISRDVLSSICTSFFVWNYDVARYFGSDFPEGI
jgi:hypothetical protein